MSMHRHFQDELSYLRTSGRAFGAAHPSVARFLSHAGTDPDVDRLLEGFAFLSARIHQRADDCTPELAHDLCELLAPRLLRPIPACAIVHLEIDRDNLRDAPTLAEHSPIDAHCGSTGATCHFRTTHALPLAPLEVTDVTLEHVASDRAQLTIRLWTPCVGTLDPRRLQRLRFFVHDAYPQASQLLWAITQHTASVTVTGKGGHLLLPNGAITYDHHAHVVPALPNERASHRLLQTYFTQPAALLFFDVSHVETAAHLMGGEVQLTLTLHQPPPLPQAVPRDCLRLNCVPVTNIFAAEAHPLRRTAVATAQLLRAEGVDPDVMQVYDVTRVTGLVRATGERVTYPAFQSYNHCASEASCGAYYKLQRRASPVDGAMDTYVSILTPSDVAPDWREEFLSVDLLCTHRAGADRLDASDFDGVATMGGVRRVRGLSHVSQAVQPPVRQDILWRLLAHMGRPLVTHDAAQLSRFLDAFNAPGHMGLAAGDHNRRRIAAMRSLTETPRQHLWGEAVVLGVHRSLEVDASHFASAGDLFVMGCVLDALFSENAPLNLAHSLQIVDIRSRREQRWAAHCGDALGAAQTMRRS